MITPVSTTFGAEGNYLHYLFTPKAYMEDQPTYPERSLGNSPAIPRRACVAAR